MKPRIVLDTPTPDAVRYLLEEMVHDQYVGAFPREDKVKWIEKQLEEIAARRTLDIQATVAYIGSGIVGIALSKPIGRQHQPANLTKGTDYWKMGNFYILKAYRGMGIGKLALETFLKEKENKVCYFADVSNKASIATAEGCGMIHTHDFAQVEGREDQVLLRKGCRIKCPHTPFQVYFGVLPPEQFVEQPSIWQPLRETSDHEYRD